MRASSASTSATLCGLTITFSSPHSGLSAGSGSSAKTSSAAPAKRAVLQALGERGLVDDRAAADVDEHGAGLDGGERVGVEQAAGGVGQRQRDDDAVGAGHQRGQLVRRVELVDVRGLARGVALDRQHAHAERLREPRGLGPDLAEADDQQRAVAQLADGLLARRPVALALVGEQLRQVLGEREQPEQRELRQRPGVHAARRRHDHVLELAGGEAQRVAQLLAGAGVAGLHPAQRGRAADDVDEPVGPAARDPEHHLRALQRLLPARVVERDAALAVAVPVPARAREQLGQVGQLDPVVGVRDPLGELRPEERAGDQDLHR